MRTASHPYVCNSTNPQTRRAWAYITTHGSLDVYVETADGRVVSATVRSDVSRKAVDRSMAFRAKRKKR